MSNVQCPDISTTSVDDEGMVGNLHWSDLLVIILYFVFVISVGIWSSLKNRGSVDGYFLAGQNMHWTLVGASLFSSCIGSEHFIGLAGTAAASGIGVFMFELNAVFTLVLLGWIFTPVYLSAGVFTMPEYLQKRFGGTRIQVYLSVLALILYVFTKISANLFAGSLFLKIALNQGKWESVVIIILISGLFTICGGLTAVMFTDFIETIIMIIGGVYLGVKALVQVGGYNEMVKLYPTAVPVYQNPTESNISFCEKSPPSNFLNFMRPVTDSELPWTGITFGLTISATWYWCTDQVIVQRALSAKNLTHAKAGTVLAGYIKFIPLFMMIFPGMVSRILYKDVIGCYDPDVCYACCGSRKGCTNLAYPTLVMNLMPRGARGLMLAVMMAALMSSQTSIFNSATTIFTMDIWRRIRKTASDMELMVVGRLFVVVLLAVSILWIPIIEVAQGSQLFNYIQSITSFLAPPICAIFVLGVSWARINEVGAFWGLMVGLVVGLIRMILEFSYAGLAPDCLEGLPDPTPSIVKDVHFLHFGIILFVLVVLVTVVISLLTPPLPKSQIVNTTFASRHDHREESRSVVSLASGSSDVTATPSVCQSTVSLHVDKDKSQRVEITNVGAASREGVDAAAAYDGLSWWKKSLFWVCGVSEMKRAGTTEPRPLAASIGGPSAIKETKNAKWICNINCVILLAIAVFIWIFFW